MKLSLRSNSARCDCRIRGLTGDTPTLHFHLKGGEEIGRSDSGFWVFIMRSIRIRHRIQQMLRLSERAKDSTEPRKSIGTWLREISSCSCLTFLPGPAWVLLSNTYKPLFAPL